MHMLQRLRVSLSGKAEGNGVSHVSVAKMDKPESALRRRRWCCRGYLVCKAKVGQHSAAQSACAREKISSAGHIRLLFAGTPDGRRTTIRCRGKLSSLNAPHGAGGIFRKWGRCRVRVQDLK